MNLTIIFCEGVHDVAFLSVILNKMSKFEPYKKPIKELPFPLDNIQKKLSTKFSPDMILTEVRNQWFPEIYTKDKNLIAIYGMGGKDKYKTLDSKDGNTLLLIQELFANYRSSKLRYTNKFDKINLGLFFDLDKDDQNELKDDIINAYKAYFDGIDKIKPDSVIKGTENFGLYFFKKDVDDLIIELFKEHKDDIFDYIETYITNPPVKHGKDYKYKKAKISIAGQLQNSGSASSTIIKKSGYINKTNLEKSKECIKIANFLSDLMEIDHV